MARNTKEISLIQIRTGDLAQLPKALHQSEFGLAKDVNRLFIGNAANTDLSNRTNDFPYQNLEVLTEFSELKNFFKYSYENNIQEVDGNKNRIEYKEFLPIVITSHNSQFNIEEQDIKINDVIINLPKTSNVNDIVKAINEKTEETKTYATVINGTKTVTFVSIGTSLTIEDNGIFGLNANADSVQSLPERKVIEKLDDFLNITDFGIKGDKTNKANEIFTSLVEVYKNYNDTQFFRTVFFPAGTYTYDRIEHDANSNYAYYPFPLISNLHVKGEGIDRTIIYGNSNYNNGLSLIECVDSNLTPSNNENYGDGSYPTNIIIEDMTFETEASSVMTIRNGSYITFNRVKFKASSDDVIRILGKDEYNCAFGITFNECIFEGGSRSIFMSEFVKNVNITNCLFMKTLDSAIQISEDNNENIIYGVNLTSNTFTNCYYKSTGQTSNKAIIKLGKGAKYVSIHQSKFDNAVIEKISDVLPYYNFNENGNNRNFIDTLDVKEDTRKHLRFSFSQPKWEYINTLYTNTGLPIVSTENDEASALKIFLDNNNRLSLLTTNNRDLDIRVSDTADVIIGSNYSGATPYSPDGNTGEIVIQKDLNLNDKHIINDGQQNIVIEPASDRAIEINTGRTENYEQLILNQPNAIPTVKFVKNQSTTTAIFKIDGTITENKLITFDKKDFGENVYIKKVSIAVTKPFYNVYDNKSYAVPYSVGYTYYEGDVVTDNTNYCVVLQEHVASKTLSLAIQDNIVKKISDSTLEDVKYVDIAVLDENGSYIFNLCRTQSFNSRIKNDQITYLYTADILNTYTYGLNPLSLNESAKYFNNDFVKHQGKVYKINYDDDNEEGFLVKALDLHDTEFAELFTSECVSYNYDLPKTFHNVLNNKNIYGQQNFAGKTLMLEYGDKNHKLISSIQDSTQLNPCGEMVISIEYTTANIKE